MDARRISKSRVELGLSQRRPGRPRFPDSIVDNEDEPTDKKARQRLAQRSYRNRKQNTLAAAQAKAARLERAVDTALVSLTNLQHLMAQKREGALPQEVSVHLSRMVSELAAAAKEVKADDDSKAILPQSPNSSHFMNMTFQCGLLEPPSLVDNGSNPVSDRGLETTALGRLKEQYYDMNSLAHKLLQLCYERYADFITSGSNDSFGMLPLLLLPLRVAQEKRQIQSKGIPQKDLSRGYWSDHGGDQTAEEVAPKAYRMIEGDSASQRPRIAPPNLQSLRRGLTRTVLQTTLPDVEGEWLEASDVEEYLAERGIYVREESSSDQLRLGYLSAGNEMEMSNLDLVHAAVPSFHEPGLSAPDWTVFGIAAPDGRGLPSGVRGFTPPFHHHGSMLSGGAGEVQDQQAMEASNPSARSTSSGMSMTVDLDNLISVLAKNAVCLGVGPGVRKEAVDLAIRESVHFN
ncbi:hypothetical protein HJFPF1_09806 [Paramyrothecium foliicola]|nr:hypothetical protein HJFPF1_09806 [Paramyrothecium foliicola]